MKYKVCFGSKVTVLPGKATEKIIEGKATLKEIRVLSALLSLEEDKRTDEVLSVMLSMPEGDVKSAINFWRGAGITEVSEEEAEEEKQTEKVAEDAKESGKEDGKQILLSEEMPKYTGEEISAMLGKDGGKLKDMIDVCQQIIGKMFNSADVETMVGLCEWLGLETDYVVTLCGYLAPKKPGLRVRYVEKAAVGLINDGIQTTEQLEEYIKRMEVFDGIAGKLRSWLGIGARDFSKSENGKINHWINDLRYGEDIIRKAYEVTVDAIGNFKFAYADSVLERWYLEGYKTVEEIEKSMEERKTSASGAAAINGQATKGGSFETSDFFEAALKRSMENIGK